MRNFPEAIQHVEAAVSIIQQRLAWLQAQQAILSGQPADKGKGRAAGGDADEETARRPAPLIPEVPPTSVEEAALEIEDLQGLLTSLQDKAWLFSAIQGSAQHGSRALTLCPSVRPACVGTPRRQISDLKSEAQDSDASLRALANLRNAAPVTTEGFGQPTPAANGASGAAPAAPEAPAAVHDLTNLVRKRRPAAEAPAEKRPKPEEQA